MRLIVHPLTLELREPFALAVGSRTTTPAVCLEVHHEGLVGYGEAALPPYLGWTQADVCQALHRVKWHEPIHLLNLDGLLSSAAAAIRRSRQP